MEIAGFDSCGAEKCNRSLRALDGVCDRGVAWATDGTGPSGGEARKGERRIGGDVEFGTMMASAKAINVRSGRDGKLATS
jgi:hypothetical protein